MIVHDCVQGDREWWALRLGMCTVSNFSKVLMPTKLGYSTGARGFAVQLITEKILGEPTDQKEVDTIWMRRGSELEAEARLWYSLYREVEVSQCGFITTDDGTVGGSPDGLVGDDGGVEIKCRNSVNHLKTVLGVDEIAGPLQVQGYLWLTGRKWWDVLAYNPNPKLKNRITRQYPMPKFQEAITKHLATFQDELTEGMKILEAAGDVIEDDNEAIHSLIAAIWAKSTEGKT